MFTSFGKINEGVTVVIMDYFLLVYTYETYQFIQKSFTHSHI